MRACASGARTGRGSECNGGGRARHRMPVGTGAGRLPPLRQAAIRDARVRTALCPVRRMDPLPAPRRLDDGHRTHSHEYMRLRRGDRDLVRRTPRDERSNLQVDMYAAILGPVGDVLALSPDEIVDIPSAAADTMYAFMAEEFVHARFVDDGDPSVVDDYLKGRGWRETVPVGRRLAHGRGEREALRRRATGLEALRHRLDMARARDRGAPLNRPLPVSSAQYRVTVPAGSRSPGTCSGSGELRSLETGVNTPAVPASRRVYGR